MIYVFCNIKILNKGSLQMKKCPKLQKKSKRGGISAKNQKVQSSKFGLFDKRGGGGPYFSFFPKFKCTLQILQLKKK